MNKQRIVVLDDKDVTRIAIHSRLINSEREIILCKDIAETRNALSTEYTHFLIADEWLGSKVSFFDYIADMKRDYPCTKIIVISGHDNYTDKAFKDKGADYFFTKPLDFQALESLLSPSHISTAQIQSIRAQIEAASADNVLLQIFDGMDIGISIVDADRKVIYANKRQIDISGQVFLGEECYKSFAPGSRIFCDKCPILEPGNKVIHVRRDGYYDIDCVPLKTPGGQTAGFAKIAVKVTDRERLVDIDKQMQGTIPLDTRISKVFEAIITLGFRRVRMYTATEDGRYLIGYAKHSQKNTRFIGKILPIETDRYTKHSFDQKLPHIYEHTSANDDPWQKYCDTENPIPVWAEIPLCRDNMPLALISVDNYDENYPDMKVPAIDPVKVTEAFHLAKNIEHAMASELLMRKTKIDSILTHFNADICDHPIDNVFYLTASMVAEALKTYWGYSYHTSDSDFKIQVRVITRHANRLNVVADESGLSSLAFNKGDFPDAPWAKLIDYNADKLIINDSREEPGWSAFVSNFQNNHLELGFMEHYLSIRAMGCFSIKVEGLIVAIIVVESMKPYFFIDYIEGLLEKVIKLILPSVTHFHVLLAERSLLSKMKGLVRIVNKLLGEHEDEVRLISDILTGLTHHDGFGFNRAVFFEYAKDVYKAKLAIGPLSWQEAEKLYNNKDLEECTLEMAMNRSIDFNKESTVYIHGKTANNNLFLTIPTVGCDDILSFPFAAKEYCTLGLQFESSMLGGIYLDNFYTGLHISEGDREILTIASNIFSLILQNFYSKRADDDLFLSMIFHRLRTDLAVPLDMLKLADFQNDPSVIDLHTIKTKLWEVINSTNDLLHFSRVRLGERKPSRSCLIVKDVIDKCIEEFSAITESPRSFSSFLSKDLHISADRPMIEHALINMIDNAIKYSPDQATISISAVDTASYVEVAVDNPLRDPMIACHTLELFERFRKGPDSQGDGLGLFIVKTIAEAHEGEVFVKDNYGTVTFGFRIPKS